MSKKEHGKALKIQIAQDKHRHEYRDIDLDPKEMVTSKDIMHHIDDIDRGQLHIW